MILRGPYIIVIAHLISLSSLPVTYLIMRIASDRRKGHEERGRVDGRALVQIHLGSRIIMPKAILSLIKMIHAGAIALRAAIVYVELDVVLDVQTRVWEPLHLRIPADHRRDLAEYYSERVPVSLRYSQKLFRRLWGALSRHGGTTERSVAAADALRA